MLSPKFTDPKRNGKTTAKQLAQQTLADSVLVALEYSFERDANYLTNATQKEKENYERHLKHQAQRIFKMLNVDHMFDADQFNVGWADGTND